MVFEKQGLTAVSGRVGMVVLKNKLEVTTICIEGSKSPVIGDETSVDYSTFRYVAGFKDISR